MFTTNQSERGFTLLETIIALGIIVIGLVGSLILISFSVGTVSLARNKFIAANLASEGIEVARNIRDTNWLQNRMDNGTLTPGDSSDDWNYGLSNGDWEVQYDSVSFLAYTGNLLRIHPTTRFYKYGPPGSQTIFKRKININNVVQDQVLVSSTVEWQERGRNYQVEAVEILYNWR